MGILGYVLPNEIGEYTLAVHKYYNKDRNKIYYTTNQEDFRVIPNTNIAYLSHSTDEFVKKQLIASKVFEINDEYVYLGVLGYVLKQEECWVVPL